MAKIKISFFTVAVILVPLLCAAQNGKSLMDQEVTVLRGDFKEVHFLVPDDAAGAEFEGAFKCTGGFNDDITFYAMEQAAYVRWFSHYPFTPLARHIKKKEGSFRFNAKAGETYYFVFDNFFSSVSNKKIHFHLNLASAAQ